MARREIPKTWDEFWGPLLLLRFHADNPDRWSARADRAMWFFEALGLDQGSRVADIGCGDGVLSICLARLGARVTAVDRIASVLAATRREPDAHSVEFLAADVRDIHFAPTAFDAVLLLDFVGLISREEDADLLRRAGTWLTPSGLIAVEGKGEPGRDPVSWSREFDDGLLRVTATYDPGTRIHHIDPAFDTHEGETIVLCDPYCDARPCPTGVARYLYSEAELAERMGAAGFRVGRADDYPRGGMFLLVGRPSRVP